MIFYVWPISRANKEPPKWENFSPDLRGKTVAQLKEKFDAVGAGPLTSVLIRADAPAIGGFQEVRLEDLPDTAVYYGRTVRKDGALNGFTPTFTVSA